MYDCALCGEKRCEHVIKDIREIRERLDFALDVIKRQQFQMFFTYENIYKTENEDYREMMKAGLGIAIKQTEKDIERLLDKE